MSEKNARYCKMKITLRVRHYAIYKDHDLSNQNDTTSSCYNQIFYNGNEIFHDFCNQQ